MVVWRMPHYLWKEAGESGWNKILERRKRNGLQLEIEARCQVLWESLLVQPQKWDASTISLSWKTSRPQIRYICSVSILYPSHAPGPTSQSLVISSWLYSCHPVSRPDNRTFFGPATLPVGLTQILCLIPVSPQFWVSCVPKRQQYSATRPGLQRQPLTLPNCKSCTSTVSATVTPRPGVRPAVWPAWRSKASSLAGGFSDKN